MTHRYTVALVLAGALSSLGAGYRVQSPNFLVDAPTPQIAQQIAQYAEHYRKEKAVQWLGREMPTWREPCPLRVTVTMQGAGGATTFEYGNGEVLNQYMQIEGSLDRLLSSVLPHEVTHTVFAQYYRCPVPRWADEGGSVLSEDDMERNRHDQLARQILNTPGRAIPLRRLMTLKEYPGDVMCLYAQGYSVTNFLVGQSNRATFLNFVAQGMRAGWDNALQTYYRYRSVEELERAWVDSLRQSRRAPVQLAANQPTAGPNGYAAPPAAQVVVRQTAPPLQASLSPPQPIVRGQAGEVEGDGWRAAPPPPFVAAPPLSAPPPSRPTAYPEPPAAAPPDYPVRQPVYPGGVPMGAPMPPPMPSGPVMLGPPQFDVAPRGPIPVGQPATLGAPAPMHASPIGYPQQ